MKAVALLGLGACLTGIGCASTGTVGMNSGALEQDFSGLRTRATSSVSVGQPRVVDAHIHLALPLEGAGVSRVQLEDGRFIVCWTRGGVEDGRRALAQGFRPDGTPLGAPAIISPPDVDVLGAPEASAMDPHTAMVTFAAASESSIVRLSVTIAAQPLPGGEAPAMEHAAATESRPVLAAGQAFLQ
jgi:hypothetical protein